ncbi:sulfatase [Nonomuraea sp. NPDC059194]|uniref:sulfatase family protein n=1 Tax=Nonomuraea sp. NPDC059194 TaxID=3346764 RepID=UPI0036CCF9F6
MRIIYVDVDTLRPDHTGPYGYQRAITPRLDAFAEDAAVLDRYYVSDSPCMPSRTALTSGQFGITNGVVGHFGSAARFRIDAGHGLEPGRPLLGQHLGAHGYLTASISSFAERHRAWYWLGNFRESIRATMDVGDEPADILTDTACEWITQHKDETDWYLHITYWDPHMDYFHDEEWTKRARELGPPPAWPDQEAIDGHAEIYGPRSALDFMYSDGMIENRAPHNAPQAIRTRADYEKLIDGYDGAIHYWDHHFGRLLDCLQDLGIYDDVAVIVSADHGESFGEQGSYAEHGLANEPTHRVPMIIRWPGLTDGAGGTVRNDALLYNIDYAPTLCDLLGLPVPAKWQGRSFAPALRGQPIEPRDYLVLGHGAHTFQRAVRDRDHLYIRTYHPGAFRAEWESLFDVTNDPYLTRNLVDERPDLVTLMRSRLMEWWHDYAGRPGCPPDPLQTALQQGPVLYNDPEIYMEHLRSTGRAHLAKDLHARLNPGVGTVATSWEAPAPAQDTGKIGPRPERVIPDTRVELFQPSLT